MKGEKGKKIGFACWWVGTGRAKLLEFWGFWLGWVRHGRATTSTGRAKLLVMLGSKFFSFFRIVLDKYLQNKLKQTK